MEDASKDPATESWALMGRLFAPEGKPRFLDISSDLGLAPQQAKAVISLREPVPMGRLARVLHCDSSNVTGIVDRLESRGLATREAAPGDRRVKMLVLTKEGEKVRRELAARFATPPEEISALSAKDQKALRDLLRKAVEG